MAQQHHLDSPSQHTSQCSCSSDETQRHDPEPKLNSETAYPENSPEHSVFLHLCGNPWLLTLLCIISPPRALHRACAREFCPPKTGQIHLMYSLICALGNVPKTPQVPAATVLLSPLCFGPNILVKLSSFDVSTVLLLGRFNTCFLGEACVEWSYHDSFGYDHFW